MDFIDIVNSIKGIVPTWVWLVISSLLAGVLTAFFRSDMFKDFITAILDVYYKVRRTKNVPKKVKNELVTSSDINNHDLFNYIDFWLYNQIPSITLKTKYRTLVFRKYLHFYFKAYKDTIQEFISGEEYKNMSSKYLKKKLLNLITSTTIKMEAQMREHDIPEVIIIKMKNVLNNRLNLTRDLIEQISDSTFYDSQNNLLKIYSFLNIIHSILDNTISNIEPVCNNINGELGGLSIDGITEPIP